MSRAEWINKGSRARGKVAYAVKTGKLQSLSKNIIACVDCGSRAEHYDHRDYDKPLEVVPVCHCCNVSRGSNAKQDEVEPDFRCPECGIRIISVNKKGERFCRRCGHSWQK